ncbi:glycosyltransferase family 2 protein [Niallia taxi]|uniref:glycosyltransferase family 2 protein n=1 Tax=Niallia taxi TaxID=2499688 RepID=UPI00398229F1
MDNIITVLIPFYNPGRYILDAISSIYAQPYFSWKILLVDDGSTDESPELVKQFLVDPRISYVRHPENLGQSASLNTGLSHIDTPFFVQLDPDDWLYPNTLQSMANVAKQQPEDVAVISGNINISFEDENGQVYMSRIKQGRHYTNPYDFLLANTSIWPRCYRTSAVREVGGWPVDDPYGGRYVEDIRILLKLIVSHRFYWIDELMLYHRRHKTNNTNEKDETASSLRMLIEETLKSWGDVYRPIFKYEEGYMILDGLEPTQENADDNA